jgi:hypothetical protein
MVAMSIVVKCFSVRLLSSATTRASGVNRHLARITDTTGDGRRTIVGFEQLMTMSVRFSDQPQGWTAAPAVLFTLAGLIHSSGPTP